MSEERPGFLQDRGNATQYGQRHARLSYIFRAPYAWAALDHLIQGLEGLPKLPQRVLDLGCGMGDVAIPLAARFEVDAVDISEGMINLGRRRPGGNHPNLRWHVSPAEEAPTAGPYGMITAGDSLHWLPWAKLFPRLRAQSHPEARLYILRRYHAREPWIEELVALEERFHTTEGVEPYDTEALLEAGDYWRQEGEWRTPNEPLRFRLEDYVEAAHSRNGFTRDRMSVEDAAAFDEALAALLEPHLDAEGWLDVGAYSTVTWGPLVR